MEILNLTPYSLKKAFNDGALAFEHRSRTLNENPYLTFTENRCTGLSELQALRAAWSEGWNQAQHIAAERWANDQYSKNI